MKILLLSIALAAILIATVPGLRNAGGGTTGWSFSSPSPSSSSSPSSAAPAPSFAPPAGNPAPATPYPRTGTVLNYRSPLGGNGGLGNASLAESDAGRVQVYTVRNLPPVRDGQVVRLRLSRATISSAPMDGNNYIVSLNDKDNGPISIIFPAEGAARMDLIHGKYQPGLTFYIALEPQLRAVGQVWRADTRVYTW